MRMKSRNAAVFMAVLSASMASFAVDAAAARNVAEWGPAGASDQ